MNKSQRLETSVHRLILAPRLHPAKLWKSIRPLDGIFTLLPLGAFAIWYFSLNNIHIRDMNDLGLVSVLTPSTILALVLLTTSFCLMLRYSRLRTPLLLLHVALLIFMLYGVTALVEDAPRFSTVYKHAGYTEYIMRTGTVSPNLDTYFDWPTFFILSAFFTTAAGFHDPLSYVAWAPLFLNLLYLGPLFLILTSASTNRRVIWLGLWLFYLTNWIGQDYFSPQGMNFFLYLVVLAILLKWFKVAPPVQPQLPQQTEPIGPLARARQKVRAWLAVSDPLITPSKPWQRTVLLLILFAVFAFDVTSHPLTPFFVLASVTALVVLRRCSPWWLPLPMGLMTAAWILVMARPFLEGHAYLVIGGFGLLGHSVTLNVADRVTGSAEHILITKLRLILTALIWGLAVLAAARRLRHGYRDLTYLLLAVIPFPLLVVQDYGGEMLLRIYLFALPFMVFFIATLLYEPAPRLLPGRWLTIGLLILNLVLLAGFLFARYGNERNDYVSRAELDAMRYLYQVAPHGSVLVRSWDAGPWQFQDFENYDYYSLADDELIGDVATNNVNAIVQFVQQEKRPHAYIVFTRSEQVTFDATSGLPPGRLALLEHEFLVSGKYRLIYQNRDVQILMFVQNMKGEPQCTAQSCSGPRCFCYLPWPRGS